MPLRGRLRVVNAIGMHKAHHRSYGHQTRNQGREYLPGF